MSDRSRPRDPRPPNGEDADTDPRHDTTPRRPQQPLRTRRDPIASESSLIRPPSRAPSWTGDRRRERGTGRYAAAPSDLPPAVLPTGAPAWMGRPDGEADPLERDAIHPRPVSGSPRRAEDYGGGWTDTRRQPVRQPDRPPTGSWPAQPTRNRTPIARPSAPGGAFGGPTGAREQDEPAIRAGDDSPARGARRQRAASGSTGPALLDDSLGVRLSLLVVVSVIALWVAMRFLIEAAEPTVALRLGSDGAVGRVGGPQALWQVPFVGTLLAVMSLGTALLIAGRDALLARLVVGGGILVQGLIWLAAVTLSR